MWWEKKMDKQIRFCPFTELCIPAFAKGKDQEYKKPKKIETSHVVTCGVMPKLLKKWPVKWKNSLKEVWEELFMYIVEEDKVLLQLILFSHWKCQEAALCGDSLVASMGVTQDDHVAP